MQKLIVRGRELIEDYGQDKYGNLEIKTSEGLDSASYIELLGTSIDFNKEVANHIKTLWDDPGIFCFLCTSIDYVIYIIPNMDIKTVRTERIKIVNILNINRYPKYVEITRIGICARFMRIFFR